MTKGELVTGMHVVIRGKDHLVIQNVSAGIYGFQELVFLCTDNNGFRLGSDYNDDLTRIQQGPDIQSVWATVNHRDLTKPYIDSYTLYPLYEPDVFIPIWDRDHYGISVFESITQQEGEPTTTED